MNPTPLSNSGHSSAQRMRAYLIELQARITSAIEGVEGQRGARFFHRRKHLLAVRDIHLHADSLAAVADDFIGDGSCRLNVIVGDGDGKAIFHQAKRDRFTNPLA